MTQSSTLCAKKRTFGLRSLCSTLCWRFSIPLFQCNTDLYKLWTRMVICYWQSWHHSPSEKHRNCETNSCLHSSWTINPFPAILKQQTTHTHIKDTCGWVKFQSKFFLVTLLHIGINFWFYHDLDLSETPPPNYC